MEAYDHPLSSLEQYKSSSRDRKNHSFGDGAKTSEEQSACDPNTRYQPTEMAKPVVFTAVAQKGGNYGPYTGDMTLVFDQAITNVGGGYDPTSGIFKAPVAGYYYFSFCYYAQTSQKSGLSLVHNNEVIVTTFDASATSDTDAHGGNAACLQLKLGDKVFVRLPSSHYVWASGNTTSFSGFLVSPM